MEIPVSASANYPYGTSAEKGLTRAPLSLSLLFQIPRPLQGEGKRAWRARVRVIVSRARGAHVACAIPRAAFEALSEKRFQPICCLNPHRLALRARPPGPGEGLKRQNELSKALLKGRRVMHLSTRRAGAHEQ